MTAGEIFEIDSAAPIHPVPISEGCPAGQGYSWQFVIIFALSILGRLAGQYIMKQQEKEKN